MPIENVISVQHNYMQNTHPSEEKVIDPNYFTIHYAERAKDAKWLYKRLILKHIDPIQVVLWVKTLQNHLQRKLFSK